MDEDFDFAVWSRLARADPDSFEAARRAAVERAISVGGDPDHLRRMQWRLDAERRRARTPLKACLLISSMMWDTFFDFQAALNRAVGYPVDPVPGRAPRAGRVVRLTVDMAGQAKGTTG
jgi:hypothetical protein